MPFFDTKDGPMVMEIPPAERDGSITGSIDDALADGAGGCRPGRRRQGPRRQIRILPPGYKDKTPDGYIALPSPTYRGYAILRSNLKSGSDADVAKAVTYGKRVKVYPLSEAAEPAGDEVRRCDRRRLRHHDSLRSALLPGARPLRAA